MNSKRILTVVNNGMISLINMFQTCY